MKGGGSISYNCWFSLCSYQVLKSWLMTVEVNHFYWKLRLFHLFLFKGGDACQEFHPENAVLRRYCMAVLPYFCVFLSFRFAICCILKPNLRCKASTSLFILAEWGSWTCCVFSMLPSPSRMVLTRRVKSLTNKQSSLRVLGVSTDLTPSSTTPCWIAWRGLTTVFYDGKCGHCSKEIDHYKKIPPRGEAHSIFTSPKTKWF